MSNLRRSTRSAIAPPIAPKKSRGMLSKNPTMPSNKADFVNCQTNQLCATFCMKSPAFESNAPINKSRKLRWRNERRVWKRTRRNISSDGEQRCSLQIRKFSCQAKRSSLIWRLEYGAVKWLLFDAVSGIQVGDKAAPIEFLNQFCVNESFRFKIGDCGIPQFHQPLHIVQTFR